MDPQKFIERHFGPENPDIIFQEVITHVPEPIAKEVKQDVEEIAEEVQKVQDGDNADEDYEKENEGDLNSNVIEGMAEKNVTPAVADLWADDNDEPSRSQKPETDIYTTQNRENCITGETFLKDAR